jgi:transposase
LPNGELSTTLTKKATKVKKGTMLAMVAGTKAESVIAIIEKLPLKKQNQVTEITLDMVANTGLIPKNYFLNATRVTDRLRVQKIAFETLQEIRIKYRWQAIAQENGAIENVKKNKKNLSLMC